MVRIVFRCVAAASESGENGWINGGLPEFGLSANGWINGMTLNTSTIHITPEILAQIVEIDEFKDAWRAISRLAARNTGATLNRLP